MMDGRGAHVSYIVDIANPERVWLVIDHEQLSAPTIIIDSWLTGSDQGGLSNALILYLALQWLA
jgi:hypothetical protein